MMSPGFSESKVGWPVRRSTSIARLRDRVEVLPSRRPISALVPDLLSTTATVQSA